MTAYVEIGYRRFDGQRHSRFWSWLIVARAAIVQQWKSKLLRWLTVLSWAPLLYFSLYFYVIGQLTGSSLTQGATGSSFMFTVALGWLEPELMQAMTESPGEVRVGLWTLAFYYLCNYTQLLAVLLVPALVGPGLIADDRRKGALLLYFSRPLSSLDYLFGKFAAVSFLVAAVSLFPMLGLYTVSILTSPSLDVVRETWPVLVRVVGAALAMLIPTSLLILFLSSVTPRRGYLAFLWVGFVIGTFVIRMVVLVPQEIANHRLDREPGVDYTVLCSYGGNLASVSAGILDAEGRLQDLSRYSELMQESAQRLARRADWHYSAWILAVLSVVAFLLTWRLVRAQDRGWG